MFNKVIFGCLRRAMCKILQDMVVAQTVTIQTEKIIWQISQDMKSEAHYLLKCDLELAKVKQWWPIGGLFFLTSSDECQINVSTQNIHKHKICQAQIMKPLCPFTVSCLVLAGPMGMLRWEYEWLHSVQKITSCLYSQFEVVKFSPSHLVYIRWRKMENWVVQHVPSPSMLSFLLKSVNYCLLTGFCFANFIIIHGIFIELLIFLDLLDNYWPFLAGIVFY